PGDGDRIRNIGVPVWCRHVHRPAAWLPLGSLEVVQMAEIIAHAFGPAGSNQYSIAINDADGMNAWHGVGNGLQILRSGLRVVSDVPNGQVVEQLFEHPVAGGQL